MKIKLYQAKNGGIYMMVGKCYTELTLKQIEDLYIDCYSLEDFDYDDFKQHYGIKIKVLESFGKHKKCPASLKSLKTKQGRKKSI